VVRSLTPSSCLSLIRELGCPVGLVWIQVHLGTSSSGKGANIDLVPNDDRMREILKRLPADWRSWSQAADAGAVTPLGWEVIGWATDVVADFYGDDWFRRNLENLSHPLMSMYDHPLSNRIAAVRHVERAARIALLPEDVMKALSKGPNGICRSTSSDEFDHLDIVLEVIGLALRDGWEVGCEVPTRSGRLPDVRVARSGFAYSIEVTTQGFDRSLRATRRQGDRLSDEQFRLEFGHSVECVTRVARLLSDEEFSEYISALEQAAAATSESHDLAEFDLGFASASVYPKGERPGTTTHEGPMLDGDLWPRFATRLRTKAEQTMGSGRSWIRIDEGGGLLALTQAYHLPIEEKLGWLMHNTAIGLADFQHVEGVVISHGAEPDWNPMANLAGVTERVSGSAVIERRLPGGRRRRTYLVRLDRGGIVLPRHLLLDPGSWYGGEDRWLDWALNYLGKPSIQTLVQGESRRELLP
jgi:hypothetical protein